VRACRFAAGVWKNVDAERFFWVELGGWLWGGLPWVSFGGEDEVESLVSSRRNVVQPESMWPLISEALTPRLQMGQTTMAGKINTRNDQNCGCVQTREKKLVSGQKNVEPIWDAIQRLTPKTRASGAEGVR
jgi:hypothetical protein